MSSTERCATLILGIGNLLMGDEGVGARVAQLLSETDLPEGVDCLDGGTGGLHLLEHFQRADRVVLVDATIDGREPGSVRRLIPRFSADYPRTLTAHDIGLKDLLDALYLLGDGPEVVLYAISIETPEGLSTEMSEPVQEAVAAVAERVIEEVGGS